VITAEYGGGGSQIGRDQGCGQISATQIFRQGRLDVALN
jgi:hypothetical protein